jgi:uncharacterized membrane protein YbaN (DUF454 family)
MENKMDKPNGPVAAALLAGGIGCAVLGVVTFANQVMPTSAFSQWLVWYKPVGALAGKSSVAIIIFLLAWAVLGLLWRRQEMSFGRIAVISFILLAVGLIGTFPPFWLLFIPPIPSP